MHSILPVGELNKNKIYMIIKYTMYSVYYVCVYANVHVLCVYKCLYEQV